MTDECFTYQLTYMLLLCGLRDLLFQSYADGLDKPVKFDSFSSLAISLGGRAMWGWQGPSIACILIDTGALTNHLAVPEPPATGPLLRKA